MEMTNDDSVKQKLLDLLAEEPTMVISTAYIYAKNFVEYGVDITKAWITAVQQASIIEKIRIKAWVEAYDSFKADYENRLKADMVAMLTDIQLEIEESPGKHLDSLADYSDGVQKGIDIIQHKIDVLKAESEEV